MSYLFLIFYLSISFLPIENMAICIEADHIEFEYVDILSKKCSDFLIVDINNNSDHNDFNHSDSHCGSCNDLLLGNSNFIIDLKNSKNEVNYSEYLSFLIFNNNQHAKIDFKHQSDPSKTQSLLSLKSVRINC